jgi:tetratricopeptide (TPR) repeat protein
LAHAQAADNSPTRERLIAQIEQPLCDHAVDLIKRAQFQSAIAVLKQAHAALPKSARLLALLGVAEYGYGFSEDAIAMLNDAIDLDPASHMAEPVLAKIVLQSSAAPSDRTKRQLCAWNEIVCAAVNLRRARASGNKVSLENATETLERAPSGDPVRVCELARAYEWQNRLSDARREMEVCIRLDGTPQNHYRLGLLYQRLGETALAAQEMARRTELLKIMSEETALASSALSDVSKHY